MQHDVRRVAAQHIVNLAIAVQAVDTNSTKAYKIDDNSINKSQRYIITGHKGRSDDNDEHTNVLIHVLNKENFFRNWISHKISPAYKPTYVYISKRY